MYAKLFSLTKNEGKLFLVPKSRGPLLARLPLNCTIAECSCKNTAENFDHYVTSRSKLFLTRTLSAFPYCHCLGISLSWMCGAECWPVSELGTENMLASDSSSESLRPPWWFFGAGEDSSGLPLGSNYSTLLLIFRKDRIVGLSWRRFSRPWQLKKRPR